MTRRIRFEKRMVIDERIKSRRRWNIFGDVF